MLGTYSGKDVLPKFH